MMLSRPSGRLLRFGTVGALVATIYWTMCVLLDRFGLGAQATNFLSYAVSIAVQYVGQSTWTFGRRLNDSKQAQRFLAAIGLGYLLSVGLTLVLRDWAGFAAWVGASVIVVVLPTSNFLLFKKWVYR